MTIGEKVLMPVCDLAIFGTRRDACYRHGAIEMRDRLSIALLAFWILIFLLFIKLENLQQWMEKNSKIHKYISGGALIGLVTSVGLKNYYPNFAERDLYQWSGFGPLVAISALCIAVVYLAIEISSENYPEIPTSILSNRAFFSIVTGVIFVVFYFPSILQTPYSLISPGNADYALNELLSPSVGLRPLVDTIPQYTSLLGWPLVPIIEIVGPRAAFWAVIFWCFILFVIINWFVVLITSRYFPNIPKFVVLLGLSSIILAKSDRYSMAGSVAGSFSSTVRLVLPIVMALLLQNYFWVNNKLEGRKILLALGCFSCLTLVNNFEFGMTASVSCSIVMILMSVFGGLNWRETRIYFLSFIGTLFTLVIALSWNYRTIQLNYWFAFAQAFGGAGFMNRSMPIFGIYFIVYAICGIGMILSLSLIFRTSRSQVGNVDRNAHRESAIALSLFGSLWTLFSLSYYAARSVEGNLQIFFAPTLITALAISKLLSQSSLSIMESSIIKTAKKRLILDVDKLPLIFLAVLPFAATIQSPDPTTEWSRMTSPTQATEWSWNSTNQREIVRIYAEIKNTLDGKIGIMAYGGNAVGLLTGMGNVLAVNSLADMTINDQLHKIGCELLIKKSPKYILVEEQWSKNVQPPCQGMSDPKSVGDGSVTLYEYSDS